MKPWCNSTDKVDVDAKSGNLNNDVAGLSRLCKAKSIIITGDSGYQMDKHMFIIHIYTSGPCTEKVKRRKEVGGGRGGGSTSFDLMKL